jgi:uncharacterized protein DUF2442
MHTVKKAKYIEDFKILMTFEDKTNKLVDLFPYLYGEIFEPLKDISYFKRFKVNKDIDTIEWANGADMSPDFLYKIGKDIAKPAINDRIKRSRRRKPISKV